MTLQHSTHSHFGAREAVVVAVALVAVHAAMFFLRVPLPHNDLGVFTEPAVLIAREGVLSGPATQYIDLLYTVGFYSYTPAYFLILGGWVWAFGAGAASLLAYTLTAHALFLWLVWALVRARFDGTRLAAFLAVASAFPTLNHGRAEVTVLLFGALAWLTLPVARSAWRLALAGVLLGVTVSASMPALGVSGAAAIGGYQLFQPGVSWRRRIVSLVILTGIAAVTAALIVAAVLYWQDAWGIAGAMWKSHFEIRGDMLNMMPPFSNTYALVFSVIPLGLLTLVPLAIGVVVTVRRGEGKLMHALAAAYLTGFAVWFLFNKGYLLFHAHFAYLARPVLQGRLVSSGLVWLRRLGVVSACLFIAVYFYFVKAQLLIPLLEDVDEKQGEALRLAPPAGTVFATDGIYFPILYRPRETISYEMFRGMDTWRLYQSATPPAVREAHRDLYREGPREPEVIIISRWTIWQYGSPDPARYEPVRGDPNVQLRLLFSYRIQIPQDALSPVVYVRKY